MKFHKRTIFLPKKQNKRVIIIGSGIGGIATAIRLQLKGYQVDVFEQNSYPGGKLAELRERGYRFDAGPSVLTFPQMIDELFELAGKDSTPYFTYEPLESLCKYFYEDGTVLEAYADPNKFLKEISDKINEPEKHTVQFLNKSKELYDITANVFLERSLHKVGTYMRGQALSSIARLHKLDAFRTMHQVNAKTFDDPRLVQLFDRYATYNGSDPYQAPATLNVISHLEHNIGGYFPHKGMYSIIQALHQLAKEVGVTFHFNQTVTQIRVVDKKVKGITTKENTYDADLVVSNMDIVPTYRKLMPGLRSPNKILDQPRSSSALIFYWGMRKQYPELNFHNIFFSRDYQQEFLHIWDKKEIYEDPTVYLYISSKFKPDDAPPGKENWYCMINVPCNTGQNWDQLNEKARRFILSKLSRMLGEPVTTQIETEIVLDPRGIEKRTSSFLGALYGNSSNNRMAAFFRHANFSRSIKGLFFCGGSVHPGGGIPLCLYSAKIVSDLIDPYHTNS